MNNRMNCYEQTKTREEDRSNNKDNINEKEQINAEIPFRFLCALSSD